MSRGLAPTTGDVAMMAETPHTPVPAPMMPPSPSGTPNFLESHMTAMAVPKMNTAASINPVPPTRTTSDQT